MPQLQNSVPSPLAATRESLQAPKTHAAKTKQIKKNYKKKKKDHSWDFPSGTVVKNLPSNAGDTGSIFAQGTNSPHASGQLSPQNY